jgi:hypothetical protein
MKKIAVNVIDEVNIEEVHNDVINFLFSNRETYNQEVANNNIQIDYFICHSNVTNSFYGPAFENSTIISSPLVNEEKMFNNVHNGVNDKTLSQVRILFNRMYRSYINSLQLHKYTKNNFYNMVISYDNCLKDFRVQQKKDFTIENDFLYTHIIEPRWLKINYNIFVCSPSTFLKIVNVWHFLKIVSDQTFKIWEFLQTSENPDRFVLPMFTNMQTIKIRDIHNDL